MCKFCSSIFFLYPFLFFWVNVWMDCLHFLFFYQPLCIFAKLFWIYEKVVIGKKKQNAIDKKSVSTIRHLQMSGVNLDYLATWSVKCKPSIRNVRTHSYTMPYEQLNWAYGFNILSVFAENDWLHLHSFPFHFHCSHIVRRDREPMTMCMCVLFSIRLCNTFIFRALESQ